MTLEQRLSLAGEVRAAGHNCAQSVLAAFPDVINLPADVTLRLGTALGGGLGLTGSTCGVLVAMALTEGMRTQGSPACKGPAYRAFASLSKEFGAKHGATLCPELKARNCSCDELIRSGITQYHNHLQKS